MFLSQHLIHQIKWRNVVCRFYKTSLCLYPKNFRFRFGPEMIAVFEDALDDRIHQGWVAILLFLVHEIIETPISALGQHLAMKANRVKNYLDILIVYTLGFILLGLIIILSATNFQNEIQRSILNLLIKMLVGGMVGLTVGIIIAPHKKTLFALCGMICLFASVTFPGLAFYIFLFVVGWTIRSWRDLFRLAVYGILVLVVGFFTHRLTAALVQSFLFHSPTQILSQTGPAMVLLPLLITGITLGILLGGIVPIRISVKA
jgi:hypothetical protein